MWMDRWLDRLQAYKRQTDRQSDRRIDTWQTDGRLEGWTKRDGQTNGEPNRGTGSHRQTVYIHIIWYNRHVFMSSPKINNNKLQFHGLRCFLSCSSFFTLYVQKPVQTPPQDSQSGSLKNAFEALGWSLLLKLSDNTVSKEPLCNFASSWEHSLHFGFPDVGETVRWPNHIHSLTLKITDWHVWIITVWL